MGETVRVHAGRVPRRGFGSLFRPAHGMSLLKMLCITLTHPSSTFSKSQPFAGGLSGVSIRLFSTGVHAS